MHGWSAFTHGWTPLFLETIDPIEPLIYGKCVPKIGFLSFIKRYEDFWRKNLKTVLGGYPFSAEKVIFIMVVRRPFPSKMVRNGEIAPMIHYEKFLMKEESSKINSPFLDNHWLLLHPLVVQKYTFFYELFYLHPVLPI